MKTYNKVEAAETRRLVAWYERIADDYKMVIRETTDPTKLLDLRQLEAEARGRAQELRAELRKAGHP